MADWFSSLKRLLTYEITIGKPPDDEPDVHDGTVLPARLPQQQQLTPEERRLQRAHRAGLVRNQLQTGLDEQVPWQVKKVVTQWSHVIAEQCEDWDAQRAGCSTDKVREQVATAQDKLYQELLATASSHIKDFEVALRENNQAALDNLPQPETVIEQKRLSWEDRIFGRTWEVREVYD